MEHMAWKGRIKPGCKAEYQRRHAEIWPEMVKVLKDAGKISAQLAKMHAETEFEKYRVVQDRLYQSDFDRYLEESGNT